MAGADQDPGSAQEPLTVNLKLLSPSERPADSLAIDNLPASTTLRGLRAEIRRLLPSHPADEQQRLIYRGRRLSRPEDTMETIFGTEELRSGRQQVVHMVVRSPRPGPPSPPDTTGPSHNTSAPQPSYLPPGPMDQLQQPGPLPQAGPFPVAGRGHEHITRAFNEYIRRLQQTPLDQQAALTEAYLHELHGMRPSSSLPNQQPPPQRPTSTITRGEGDLIRGQEADQIVHMFRDAIRSHTLSQPADSMGRPTTTEAIGAWDSRNVAARRSPQNAAVPEFNPTAYVLSSPDGPRGLLINNAYNPTEWYATPHAYANSASLSAMFQSQLSATANPWGQPAAMPNARDAPFAPPGPAIAQIRIRSRAYNRAVPPPQPAPAGLPPVRRGRHAAPRPANDVGANHANRANNPGQGNGHQALAAALWPHIWLSIRLAIFVWWFTSGDSSWTRWLAVVAFTIVVFMINTGLLNGLADRAWEPFRRRLDGLMPMMDHGGRQHQQHNHAQQGPGRNNDGNPAAQAQAPGALAAERVAGLAQGVHQDLQAMATGLLAQHQRIDRLMAEHQHQPNNWLMGQVRRIERAGMLFLASIAPGIAENHIAQLEARGRAERQRTEAAAEEEARRLREEGAAAEAQAHTEREQTEQAAEQPELAPQGQANIAAGENEQGDAQQARPPHLICG